MALFRQPQTNFTAGVLDAKLAAREDIVFYYNGLKNATNLQIIPQGGAQARHALQFVRRLSPILAAITLAAGMITAPNGGSAANLVDGDLETAFVTTAELGTVDPFVAFHLDAGADVSVSAIDLIDYKLSEGVLAGEFFVQYSLDNSAWQNFAGPFDWDASIRTRRLKNPAGAITARYWRVVRIGATNVEATVSLAGLKFWAEGADYSSVKCLPFAYSTQQAYMMIATEGNIDVLKGAEFCGAVPIPHSDLQIPAMRATQTLDTMLVFHRNVRPYKIFRQGDDDEFDARYASFTNVPQYDYGAGVGGADEVQSLNDGSILASGDDFTILLEGNRTKTITAASARADTAAAIQAALRALPNTSADGIVVTDDGSSGFIITFGGDDGKRPWNEMTASVMSGAAAMTFSRTVKGEPEGEDIMSDVRGWPRDGVFHQSRLNLVGINGVPDAWIASVLNDYYNFDTTRDDDTKGLLLRAESDQVSALYHIVAGKHLTFFANDGEFYNPNTKLDKDAYMRATTEAGSKEGVPPFRVEGSLVFIQGVANEDGEEIGTSIREMIYDDGIQNYRTNLLSKLSAHLIKNPVDAALQKSIATSDPNILIIINEDGTAAHYTILREDDVNAFMPISLDGPDRSGDIILACGVDKRRRVYYITERVISGETVRFIEMVNRNLYLDCGGIVTPEAEVVPASVPAQDVYVWTFDSPADDDDITVRLNGGRLPPSDYTVDLDAKTVTLVADLAADIQKGDRVRVAKHVTTVTGLDHLEGETLQTIVDGSSGENVVVSGGAFTLSTPGDIEIQYGFEFEVSGELLPLRIPESQSLAAEPVRIVNAIFYLQNCIGLQIKANGGDWQDVELKQSDSAILDRSAIDLAFSGEVKVEGLMGAAVGAPLAFRRSVPGPFTILGAIREVDL